VPSDVRRNVEDELLRWLAPPNGQRPERLGSIRTFSIAGERMFAAVLRRETIGPVGEHREHLQVAIIRLRDLKPIEIPWLLGGLGALVAAAVLVTVAHSRHRRRQEMGILRSAPIGVVVTLKNADEDHARILFGNDRAEDVLGMKIEHRVHLEPRSKQKLELGKEPQDVVDGHDARRSRWEESTYTIKYRGRKVRVTGSPLLLSRGGKPATYGVITDADDLDDDPEKS
jgi:PAS domain-containing protein